jgi:hypothetical protein
MRKKKRKPDAVERFLALSDAGREAEVAPFDRQEIGPGKPLSARERKLWSRVKSEGRRRGRPTIGQGSKLVPVTIERGLLADADKFARRHRMKRSQMVAEGLRLVMQRERGAA